MWTSSRNNSLYTVFSILAALLFCAGSAVAQGNTDAASSAGGAIYQVAKKYYEENFGKQTAAQSANTGPVGRKTVSSVSKRILSGPEASEQFGSSAASAGDVNGDGYPDIIVGAYEYGSVTGRAYIYFGGPGMKSTPDIILTGEGTNQDFGTSVAGAGDVNGDGYADVIVGANGYNTHTGRAYIYFGGPHMTGTPDVILNGESSGDNFGSKVAGAGDVNGDGYADVIVGAFGNSSSRGRVYVYFGGPNMSSSPAVKLSGQSTGDLFGMSVSSAGDVNGDGYSDILIGASGRNSATGRAYVFLGGKSVATTPYLTLDGEAAGDEFGYSASSAGDVNGDGYSDFMVGAFAHNSSEGKVYLYYGGPDSNATATVTFSGETAGSIFGYSIACAGDVNGDGYSDLVIGAPGYSSGTGRVYLYYGGKLITKGPGDEISGDGASAGLGTSVSGAGDLKGDGFSEYMAGETGYNSHEGAECLFAAPMRGSVHSDFDIVSTGGQDLGVSLTDAGDVNGDGYHDVAIGGAGKVYIYFGGPKMDTTADVVLAGATTAFGTSIAGLGDINGDGYSDLAVGDPNDASGSGKVFVYFGGKGAPLSTDSVIDGSVLGQFIGKYVAAAGDLNGDGYNDVAVGDYYDNPNSSPAVFVFWGGKTFSTTNHLIVETGDYTTTSDLTISSGDINNDGYSDLLVGDPYANSNAGAVYVFYGGTSMTGDPDGLINGQSASERFGDCISSGDFNGDGYADFAVGAPNYGNGAGRVLVYEGSRTLDTVASAVIYGRNTAETFGISVAAAGDINGDGYSDIVVGTIPNSGNFATHVYFGGQTIDTVSDMDLNYTGSGFGFFGTSVTTCDYNGDGLADVIVASLPAHGIILSLPGGASFFISSPVRINPDIESVKDVPNDQGGAVTLDFRRSGYDAGPNARITDYVIERSMPPGATGFAWEKLATIQPNHNVLYSYTASTPYDSTTNSSGTFYFRVTAQTSSQQEYWRSNIMAGHSVDNIPPAIPTGISAAMGNNAVDISWADSAVSDLKGFQVFRSTVQAVNPDTMRPIAVATTTHYTDGDPLLNSKAFYFVRAEDVHGNFSALSVPTSITIGTTGKVAWAQTSGPYGGEVHTLFVGHGGALYAGTSLGGVYKSSNSGTSWTQISSGISTLEIASLAEDASGNLFAGSDGDGIYMSTNGGANWVNSSAGLPGEEYVEAVNVLRNGIMVAGTYSDGLYYSTTGGKDWHVSSDASNEGSAFLEDSGRVYCGTGNGVEVSTDNGMNWTVTGLANREVLCLLDGLNGRIYAGTDEGVFVSSDRGSTWTRSGLPNLYLHALVMDASGNMFTGSDQDGVFMSKDNGATWTAVNDSLGDLEMESLAIDASGQLYAGTYTSGVFRAYRTTGGTTGISASQAGIPKEYGLSQNYPNPFNPTTTISYQLPASGNVTLRVYDILGRGVSTLVDGRENAGRYAITFDGSRLASGVYFYRLIAEGNGKRFVSTKKLLLMK